MTLSRISLALLALASLSSFAAATDYTVTALNGSQGWYVDANTGTNPISITSPTNDGDGALRFSGTGNEKQYVSFGAGQGFGGGSNSGNAAFLGTLGQLATGSVSADLFRTSTNASHPTLQVAVKIIFAGNRQLTWESAYNDQTNAATTGSWVSQMMGGSGNWWLRGASTAGSYNFDQIANLHSLSDWASGAVTPSYNGVTYTGLGLNASSEILGFSVGYGSFVGAFDGSIDHLKYSFTGGSTYNFNFRDPNATSAVPGPAAALAFGLGFFRRRNKRA